MVTDIANCSAVRSIMSYGNGYSFSIPQGYAPISNDRYLRQEELGCKGWVRLVKLSLLWLDAITCFAAEEEGAIIGVLLQVNIKNSQISLPTYTV